MLSLSFSHVYIYIYIARELSSVCASVGFLLNDWDCQQQNVNVHSRFFLLVGGVGGGDGGGGEGGMGWGKGDGLPVPAAREVCHCFFKFYFEACERLRL